MELDQAFWQERWLQNDTPWDMGSACPALTDYISQVANKDIKILIPGAGSAHEAVWLWENGFKNFVVLDWSEKAFDGLRQKLHGLKPEQIQIANFFDFDGQFDLILEQTFFCALTPSLREAYVVKMADLLKTNGTLAGLLFDFPLESGPPFGGNEVEYRELLGKSFEIKTMSACYNSIQPRAGRELFFIAKKL